MHINERVHNSASVHTIPFTYSDSQLIKLDRQQIQHHERNWLWAFKILLPTLLFETYF
jgi:hypothetical protein